MAQKRKQAPAPKPKPQKKRRSCIGMLFRFCFNIFLLGVIGFLAFCVYYYLRASKFKMEEVAIMPERSIIYDRNDSEIGKIHGENRTVIPFDQISSNFLMSIIAREDARFYEHYGVDFKGLARATLRNIKDRRMTQGASTITMQLARNSFDLSQGDKWYNELDRKFLEIFVTFRIEQSYEKTEILGFYCNRIFWGHSMLGIESASQTYLDKAAKNLTLSEGAMLAGIVRGPNAFSPFRSIKLATRERDTVLDRLVYYHYITEAEGNAAKAEPLRISPKKSRGRTESYAMDAISKELTDHLLKRNIKVGGLKIYTTLDSGLQKVAEESLNNRLVEVEKTPGYKHQTRWSFRESGSKNAPSYIQGALVCIDNSTGGIVATVGGRNATESRFNRAYYARRQVGSLFKPFVFQAAFDRGLRPRTKIDDSKIKPGDIDHSDRNWSPNNSDGRFLGLIEAREALLKSRNTSSVRVGDYATLEHVQRAAEVAEFKLFQWNQRQEGKTPNNAQVYLGAWEASPEEVATAYTVFPNQGVMRKPYIISKIVDRNGDIVFDKSNGGVLIVDDTLSRGATHEVSKILEDINISGTGASLRNTHGFKYPSAGKTGTTDNYKDAWYAGYTSELTCAVWVGLDTPKKTIDRGYGSRLALPIWADLMKVAAKKAEFSPKPFKSNLTTKKVVMCNRSSRLASHNCRKYGCAYEDEITLDLLPLVNKPCTIHNSGNILELNLHTPEPIAKVEKESVVSGLLNKLLGKSKKPPKAIIVEEDELYQEFPDPTPKPARAIVVEEHRPAIKVRPAATPNIVRPASNNVRPPKAEVVEPRKVSPKPISRSVPVTPPIPPKPARAVIVEEPRILPQTRAVVVEEDKPKPAKAIVIDDPTPARAVVVDPVPPKAIPLN